MPTFKLGFFYAVTQTAGIPFVSINLTHHIKFPTDQMKSVRVNEANRFCVVLILWPLGSVKIDKSGIIW